VVTEDELGDLLLEAVRAGSAHGLDPEQALRKAVRRFQSRVMQERPGGDLD
jgi:NTP pyrophosphatase (non-canonical NTP hydrolase)